MAYIPCKIGGGTKATLLWTNPNPTSAFANQTLNIDFTDYEWILIEAYNRVDIATRFLFDTIFKKELGQARWSCIGGNSDGSGSPLLRTFTINQTSLNYTYYSNTQFNVPVKIYGIKKITI